MKFWKKIIGFASTTGEAPLQLPHGSEPSSPADGDMWTTSSSIFVRINGVTKDLAVPSLTNLDGGSAISVYGAVEGIDGGNA
jgi:hypothetical protein